MQNIKHYTGKTKNNTIKWIFIPIYIFRPSQENKENWKYALHTNEDNILVCSNHFNPQDYLITNNRKRPKLKDSAIPSLVNYKIKYETLKKGKF
jgi:hypothetical protein